MTNKMLGLITLWWVTVILPAFTALDDAIAKKIERSATKFLRCLWDFKVYQDALWLKDTFSLRFSPKMLAILHLNQQSCLRSASNISESWLSRRAAAPIYSLLLIIFVYKLLLEFCWFIIELCEISTCWFIINPKNFLIIWASFSQSRGIWKSD